MLPEDWRAVPWPSSTREIGMFWYEQEASLLLEVPSAVVPRQKNYLINVTHSYFGELEINDPEPFEINTRLT